jgi:hypothetical protein
VGFLRADLENEETGAIERVPVGTGFFLAVPTADERIRIPYVITTAHTVYGARALGSSLHLRLPLEDGGHLSQEIAPDTWTCHERSDVAAAHVRIPEGHAIKWLLPNMLLTREQVEEVKVGLGDELFLVSLFEQLPGRVHDLPVVRFGNISRLPDESVAIDLAPNWTVDVEAYLAETRSWGGESGAPTFLYFSIDRHAEGLGKGTILVGNTDLPSSIANVQGLLGIVHGHYDIARKVKGAEQFGMMATVDVNAGMAVVIPAWTILETLEKEELVEERERIEQESRNEEPTPTPDHGLKDPSRYQRKDFLRDLEKVTKPEPRDEAE